MQLSCCFCVLLPSIDEFLGWVSVNTLTLGSGGISPFTAAADTLFRQSRRYVCYSQLDPVSAEATHLTADTFYFQVQFFSSFFYLIMHFKCLLTVFFSPKCYFILTAEEGQLPEKNGPLRTRANGVVKIFCDMHVDLLLCKCAHTKTHTVIYAGLAQNANKRRSWTKP